MELFYVKYRKEKMLWAHYCSLSFVICIAKLLFEYVPLEFTEMYTVRYNTHKHTKSTHICNLLTGMQESATNCMHIHIISLVPDIFYLGSHLLACTLEGHTSSVLRKLIPVNWLQTYENILKYSSVLM